MKKLKIILVGILLTQILLAQNNCDSNIIIQNTRPLDTSLLYLRTHSNLHLQNLDVNWSLNIDPLDEEVNYYYLAATSAVAIGTLWRIRNYYANTWWKDQRTGFKFTNDWQYAHWIDKYGHFIATYSIANMISFALDAANLSGAQVVWYSSLTALAFQTYVEIEDAYAPNWGFSPGDAIANVLGSGYRVAQYYYPFLKNFVPKFSYFPSKELRDGLKKDNNMSDDYEGQKIWLSFRMKNLLPKDVAKFWPAFLMLSVGYGIENYPENIKENYYLAFDVDIEQLPIYGEFGHFIKNAFNLLHFPMPGIRFTSHGTYLEIVF